jgi:hypothetical protein
MVFLRYISIDTLQKGDTENNNSNNNNNMFNGVFNTKLSFIASDKKSLL